MGLLTGLRTGLPTGLLMASLTGLSAGRLRYFFGGRCLFLLLTGLLTGSEGPAG